MFINYFKGEPNQYIIAFRNGKIEKRGSGINFFYAPWSTSIAVVSTASQETPFIFKETTADYQEIAIQGALTYRLIEPEELAQRLDFTVDQRTGGYKTRDPEKLIERIVNAVQSHTRNAVNELALEQSLTQIKDISTSVLKAVGDSGDLHALGVVLETLHFNSVKASPEMQKALEADFRESLNKRADQAIYDRRFAASAEERKLKESEMNTEVELENRRKELVDTQARNNLALAEADAKAEEMRLDPYGSLPPQALVGLALKEWAGNAGNIGNLSISPDILERIVGWVSAKQ